MMKRGHSPCGATRIPFTAGGNHPGQLTILGASRAGRQPVSVTGPTGTAAIGPSACCRCPTGCWLPNDPLGLQRVRLGMAISSPRATRSSRREKWVFASKEPAVSTRPRGLAGGLSRYADECWVVAAAVTGRAGTSGQRMPRRRRVRWLPDDRLGGRIAGRGVQVAPHSSGRGLFTHEKNPLPRWHPRGFHRVPCPPATLSEMAGEERARHRPPRNRPRCHRDDRLVSEPAMSSFFG